MRSIRSQVRWWRWLRRRSDFSQCLVTWVQKAATASVLPGPANRLDELFRFGAGKSGGEIGIIHDISSFSPYLHFGRES